MTAYIIWLFICTSPLLIALVVGGIRMSWARRRLSMPSCDNEPVIEILVPAKGNFPDLKCILASLLLQEYSNYKVTFLVEDDADPAASVIRELTAKNPHSRLIITGRTIKCAQKNHNLIVGLNSLYPETELVVFCDSTNRADNPSWLRRLTKQIRCGQVDVVTTFRKFIPQETNYASMCQTIYSSIMLFLATIKPTPWGGGTAIRRTVLERIKVLEAWSDTIVDDLILGNALKEHGVPVAMEAEACLLSPLPKQTLGGYVHYLDRQVMFPKFTNPGLWLGLVLLYSNLAVSVAVSITVITVSLLGFMEATYGWISFLHIVLITAIIMIMGRQNPHPIPAIRWILAVLPCIFINWYVVLRSVHRSYIDWHGKRYWPGKRGKVLNVTILR